MAEYVVVAYQPAVMLPTGSPSNLSAARNLPPHGSGYLAGEFPDGITSVGGVPVAAKVRVLYRPASGENGDGAVVAEVDSLPDGTWRVDGLDPSLRYDVIGRKNGFNDVIMADVTPAVAP